MAVGKVFSVRARRLLKHDPIARAYYPLDRKSESRGLSPLHAGPGVAMVEMAGFVRVQTATGSLELSIENASDYHGYRHRSINYGFH